MKWLGYLLLALAGVWLGWPGGGERQQGDKVVKSLRPNRDRDKRAESKGFSELRKLESFAEGLSEEELWEELDLAYEGWLADKGAWKGQPNLAIMLAREIGKREGELGLKTLAAWLEDREVEVKLIDGVFDMTRPSLHSRIRLGGYGGWVTRDPDRAIDRLIEAGEANEKDWPVIDVRPNLSFRAYEGCGIEEILRCGFAQLAKNDLMRAKELLFEGARSEVFDVTKIAEALFLQMSEDEIGDFRNELILELNGGREGLEEDLRAQGLGVWEMEKADDFFAQINFSLPVGVTAIWPPPGAQDFSVLVRARPELALEILRDRRASETLKTDLVTRLALADQKHYGLIDSIPDGEKVELVETLLRGNSWDDFGPVTGIDDPGTVNPGELRSAVEGARMADSVRSEIQEFLNQRED